MRNIVFFVLYVGMVSLFGQEMSSLSEIRAEVRHIDTEAESGDFTMSSFEDENGEVAELTVFIQQGSLARLKVKNRDQTNQVERIFYLFNGDLIFVQENMQTVRRIPNWEEAKSEDLGNAEFKDATEIRKSHNQYYFENNQLVQWLGDKNTLMNASEEDYTKKQGVLIGQLERLNSGLDQ